MGDRMDVNGFQFTDHPKSTRVLQQQGGLRFDVRTGAVRAGDSGSQAISPNDAASSELRVTAEDRQHWSFRPLHEVQPPTVKDRDWCATTIDQFVLAAMEAKGLRPNLRADRQTLIRQVYFDLIGLPPSPEQVAKFEADARDSAYEALVDELLNSPHYGERWGGDIGLT